MSIRRTTGLFFIVAAVSFAGASSVLSATFDWPGILREPAPTVLTQFTAGGDALVWTWFATGWTYALLAVPMLLLPVALRRHAQPPTAAPPTAAPPTTALPTDALSTTVPPTTVPPTTVPPTTAPPTTAPPTTAPPTTVPPVAASRVVAGDEPSRLTDAARVPAAMAGSVLRGATLVGAASVLLSLIGFLRWVFVVPALARSWTSGSPTTRAAVEAAWTAQHQFGGALLGEHLGQLLAIAWSVAVSVLALRNRVLPRWIGGTGLVASALYLLNQGDVMATALPGFPVWDAAGFLGSTAWGLWVAALGVTLVLPSKVSGVQPARAFASA